MPTYTYTAQTQANVSPGHVLLEEWSPQYMYCRESLTINVSQTILVGTILEYNAPGYDASQAAGAGTAAAIALEAVTTTALATQDIMCLVRGPAVVKKEALTVVGGAAYNATDITNIEALGIQCFAGVTAPITQDV
jgi:hypothetical protein